MTMLSNETVRKLHEMRLGVMAEAFSAQLEDAQFQAVSFEDRFAMLVDAEWSARKSNRLTRLIRNAGYADPAACVENIEYHPERRLDREQRRDHQPPQKITGHYIISRILSRSWAKYSLPWGVTSV